MFLDYGSASSRSKTAAQVESGDTNGTAMASSRAEGDIMQAPELTKSEMTASLIRSGA
ncbi:MAG: hypothetical protein RIF42_05865 [Parvibaculaceae bacterium]